MRKNQKVAHWRGATNHRRDSKENYRGRRIPIPTDTLGIGVLGRLYENFVIMIYVEIFVPSLNFTINEALNTSMLPI